MVITVLAPDTLLPESSWCRQHFAVAAGGSAEDSTWLGEMFGSFLSLHEVPGAHQALNALTATRTASASFGQARQHKDVLIPILHMLLPNASLQAVSMLVSLV